MRDRTEALGGTLERDDTDREVRVTALEDQDLVHFVFGHTTLGTLHRAEHRDGGEEGEGEPDPEDETLERERQAG